MKTSFAAATLLILGLSTPAVAAPVQWTTAAGGNDHWYEVVWPNTGPLSWSTANSLAQSSTNLGQSGYLATITSAAEQIFLNTLNSAFALASSAHHGEYVRAWLGGSDAADEGEWEWGTGEAFTYTNWAPGQPNDWGTLGQDHLSGWYNGDQWNDCRDYTGSCGIYKYVVEYDSATVPSPVPVPATLPLVIAGLGALTFFGRRRKKS
jgi:hypothetical protein